MTRTQLICKVCQRTFHGWRQNQQYCSKKCQTIGERTVPDKICPICLKIFRPHRHRQFCCSKKCALTYTARHRVNSKGKYKTTHGYILLYKPGHPTASKTGYIMEHRWVMERVLGRLLDPAEVVHHLNKDKTDNRPENLVVMDKRTHDNLRQPQWIATCPCCGHKFPTAGHVHDATAR